MPKRSLNRRQEILEALARELESQPQARVTTAQLAKALDVSEAALYRHFPSKARMFEGLIEFAEESVFGLQQKILDQHLDTSSTCRQLLTVLLGFAAKNPGITRVLLGHAIVGEHPRLQARVGQFFEHCESRLRQALNRHNLVSTAPLSLPPSVATNLLMAYARGRLLQYLQSGFKQAPDADWEQLWPSIERLLFRTD